MKTIVAVDEEWGIGKKNGLLFSLKEDMRFFRDNTLNKVVVMGGNTLLSFPGSKPLKNRVNIVLSDVLPEGDYILARTLPELLEILKGYPSDDVFVIGGAMMYMTMLSYCSEALITKVAAVGGAEVFFPNLDEKPEWNLVSEGTEIEDNGYKIKFTTYHNDEVQPL